MTSTSFAIARDVPVGVVIVAYSSQLSRMFLWNPSKDLFEPGQWLKGRASVLDISPDGRYVSYFVEAFHRRQPNSYLAVSRPPYFTALLFQPAFHLMEFGLMFQDGEIRVYTEHSDGPRRVEPGCPMSIVEVQALDNPPRKSGYDPHRKRELFGRGDSICMAVGAGPFAVVESFPRGEFEEIETPDWAKAW